MREGHIREKLQLSSWIGAENAGSYSFLAYDAYLVLLMQKNRPQIQ
jgi:hypothetical protein